jgi:hypothetical protein
MSCRSTMSRLCELKSGVEQVYRSRQTKELKSRGLFRMYTRQIAGILAQRAKDSRPCAFSDGHSFLEFWKREDHKFGLNYRGKFLYRSLRQTADVAALYCDQNQPGLLNRNNLVGSSKEFAE